MKIARPLLVLAAVSLLLNACASSNTGIQIEDAWARPALAGENSAIYFRITSHGRDDTLLRAELPVAKKAELHRSIMEADGTVRMEQQDQIDLPADEPVELAPGGLHVMLMGLFIDLDPGDAFALKLIFKNHAEMLVDVPIQTP